MALADLEIVRVVRGRDFDDAGAEFAVDVSIRDDRNFTIHQREHHGLADEALVALVIRMDRDRRIAEHRFRPRGRHDEKFFGASDRIAEMPELPRPLDVNDFEIADRGLAARAPIDHVRTAIEQPFVVEAQESFEHGAVKLRLEREMLARPIARGAEPDHLSFDRAAALRLPLPHAPLEFLAAEFQPADPLLVELALDDVLRADTGVVHAGQPESVLALHAMPADQHVDLRVLEQVAYVDRARDVGRRQRDRECRAIARILGAEELFLEPGLRPALFDFLRLVSLGNFPGHAFPTELDFVQTRNIHDKRRVWGWSNRGSEVSRDSGEVGHTCWKKSPVSSSTVPGRMADAIKPVLDVVKNAPEYAAFLDGRPPAAP